MNIDKEELKALSEAARKSRDWYSPLSFGLSRVTFNAERDFIGAAGPETVLALLAEIDQLKAENEALRSSKIFWVSKPGSGLIRCVPDSRYRVFAPSIRALYSPVLVQEDQQLRKDAERYRWLRERDLETISHGGVFAGITPQNMVINLEDLDSAVDEAMAKEAK